MKTKVSAILAAIVICFVGIILRSNDPIPPKFVFRYDDEILVENGKPMFSNNNNNNNNNIIIRHPRSGMLLSQPQPHWNRTLTLIVHLRGELGNHLSILANARWIQRFVEREIPGVKVALVGSHQSSGRKKWQKTAQDLLCFANLRRLNVSGGYWDATTFLPAQEQRQKWLGAKTSLLKDVKTLEQVQFLKHLLQQQEQSDPRAPPIANHLESSELDGDDPVVVIQYSMPFLIAKEFLNPFTDVVVVAVDDVENRTDNYRDLREFFRFLPSCCHTKPEPGEAVLHLRNFAAEMGMSLQNRQKKGYMELPQTEMVDAFFSDTNNNSNNMNATSIKKPRRKVAIIGRIPENFQTYANAIQQVGWDARVVEAQSGVQDFCFALSTSSTLIGVAKSTFAIWAGILGHASVVRWYSVHAVGTGRPHPQTRQQRKVSIQSFLIDGRTFYLEHYRYDNHNAI